MTEEPKKRKRPPQKGEEYKLDYNLVQHSLNIFTPVPVLDSMKKLFDRYGMSPSIVLRLGLELLYDKWQTQGGNDEAYEFAKPVTLPDEKRTAGRPEQNVNGANVSYTFTAGERERYDLFRGKGFPARIIIALAINCVEEMLSTYKRKIRADYYSTPRGAPKEAYDEPQGPQA
jgi:hypothetical protein